jgi:hypothetical protein
LFFDSLRFLAASCKRPFAKFEETLPFVGCRISMAKPLSALEGRGSPAADGICEHDFDSV